MKTWKYTLIGLVIGLLICGVGILILWNDMGVVATDACKNYPNDPTCGMGAAFIALYGSVALAILLPLMGMIGGFFYGRIKIKINKVPQNNVT